MGLSSLWPAAIAGGLMSGIGTGASAIAQDTMKRDELARQAAATAEQQRHNRAMEGYQQEANIMEMPVAQIPAPFRPAGADPNGTVRVNKSMLPLYQQFRTEDQNRQAGEQAANALLRAGTQPADATATASPEFQSGTGAALAAPGAQGAVTPQVDPHTRALASVLPYLYKNPEVGKAVLGELAAQRENALAEKYLGGGGNTNGLPQGVHLKLGPLTLGAPPVHYAADPEGNAVMVTPNAQGPSVTPIPGVKAPERPGMEYVKVTNQLQAMENEVRAGRRTVADLQADPAYQTLITRANRLKIVPEGAGGALKGAGDITSPFAERPQPGAPPGAMTPGGTTRSLSERPPIPNAAEANQAADAQTWIKQARDAANKLETYMGSLTPAQRASFAARVKVQGWPIVSSLPGITSKQEQEITSAIGNLQIAWERASGGLRMASSPQMQERIRSIFGDPTNAATPQHLRTIAGQMEQEIQQRAKTEQQAGRQPIALPPQGGAAPPQGGTGTLSRQSAIYQRAHSQGLSDAEIESVAGARLVP